MPLSDTLDTALRDYQIGAKVHRLRMSKKMGLVELGQHSGLSPAILSKIENSRTYPPLPTLLRIAMVFGVGLDHFFSEAKNRVAIVRKGDRQRFASSPDSDSPSYYFESLDFEAKDRKLSSYLAEFVASSPESTDEHSHGGDEFIYVLEGVLGLRVGKARYEVEEGDSVYLDARVAHGYWRVGKHRCRAVVTTTG